jgi:hypothetical protein
MVYINGLSSNLNLSQTKEFNQRKIEYSFETMALKQYFGIHYKNRHNRNKILNAYEKIRPNKQINDMIYIARQHDNITDQDLKFLMMKWLKKNEKDLKLKIDSIEGRQEENRIDIVENIDLRSKEEMNMILSNKG